MTVEMPPSDPAVLKRRNEIVRALRAIVAGRGHFRRARDAAV